MFLITVLWLASGFFFSLLAIYVFRRNGKTQKDGELYFAVLGPLFGPVVGILLALDLYWPAKRD